MTHRVLTEREAAEYLKMSVSYLRQSRAEGQKKRLTPGPPFIKMGRAVRYLVQDLDHWLEEHRSPSPRPELPLQA